MSSQDSDFSYSPIISNSSYRVSVCLKRYFCDVRALCYMLVNRKRNIEWLEKRISKLFNISSNFCLTTRGHLLPSSELLSILNPDDLVEVIPQEKTCHFPQQDKFDTNGQSTIDKDIENKVNEKDLPDIQNIIVTNRNSNKIQIMAFNERQIERISASEMEKPQQKNVEIISNVLLQQNTHSKIHSAQSEVEPHSLEQLKKDALALLDDKFGDVGHENDSLQDTIVPRKRRRVRKRPRCVTSQNCINSKLTLHEPENYSLTNGHPSSRTLEDNDLSTSFTTEDKESETCVSPAALIAMSNFITRNELTSVRKPRIVRPLIDAS